MKLLYLAPEPPTPPYSGGRERARQVLGYLARRHAVSLLTYAAREDEPGLAALRTDLAGLVALPYPVGGQRYSDPLRAAAIEVARRAREPFDAVHAQGLDAWPAARDLRVDRILELHDLPRLLRERALVAGAMTGLGARFELRRVRRDEARAVEAARRVIVASAHDAEALRRAYALRPPAVTVVPNGVDVGYWAGVAERASEPATLLFPGALNWRPNVDAARVLAAEVLPRVRARVPEARLVLAGRQPDRAVRALAAHGSAVELVADPPDMRPLFARATVVAVPLRFASGTRLKILQALAAGRPLVTTPLGLEGLDLVPGWHLRVAPLVEPFADEVTRLLRAPEERQALAAAGREGLERFEWGRVLEALDEVYARG